MNFAQDMLKKLHSRKQITIVFTVKTESVPGMFYDPEDFATQGFKAIENTLMAYKPELISTDVKDADDTK